MKTKLLFILAFLQAAVPSEGLSHPPPLRDDELLFKKPVADIKLCSSVDAIEFDAKRLVVDLSLDQLDGLVEGLKGPPLSSDPNDSVERRDQVAAEFRRHLIEVVANNIDTIKKYDFTGDPLWSEFKATARPNDALLRVEFKDKTFCYAAVSSAGVRVLFFPQHGNEGR